MTAAAHASPTGLLRRFRPARQRRKPAVPAARHRAAWVTEHPYPLSGASASGQPQGSWQFPPREVYDHTADPSAPVPEVTHERPVSAAQDTAMDIPPLMDRPYSPDAAPSASPWAAPGRDLLQQVIDDLLALDEPTPVFDRLKAAWPQIRQQHQALVLAADHDAWTAAAMAPLLCGTGAAA